MAWPPVTHKDVQDELSLVRGAFTPQNPPPDSKDPLALTAYNPYTSVTATPNAVGESPSSGAVRVGCNDTRLTYRGAAEMSFGPNYPDTQYYRSSSLYPHTYGSQPTFAVEFMTDALWFEFQVKYINAGQAWRLLIDGRRVTETPVPVSTTTVAVDFGLSYRFDFLTSTPRRICIELWDLPFNGIFIPSGAQLWEVPAYVDRTLVVSDSLTQGSSQNTGGGHGTWLNRVALRLGWEDWWNQSLNGNGYVVAGGGVNFGARSTGVVAGSTSGLNDVGQYGFAAGITRVIVWGGYNDAQSSQATISTNASTLFQNIKAAIPLSDVIVIGCWSPIGNPDAALINTDNTLQAAALASGVPFISLITGKTYTERGTVILDQGALITTANAAEYVSSDNVHPNDKGYTYMSARIADSITALQSTKATQEPWAGGLHVAIDDGRPSLEKEWNFLNGPGTLNTLTPTSQTLTVARCWSYNSQFSIVVNRVRWYGIGATNQHRLAVYRWSDGAQIIGPLTLTTTADAWNSAAVPSVTLASNTAYIVSLSAIATNATAGLRTSGAPMLYPPLQSATPGGLALMVGDHRFWFGQFTVTNGVLPAIMPTLVRGTGWTAGIPLFFFDSNNAA